MHRMGNHFVVATAIGLLAVVLPTTVPGFASPPTYGHDLACTNDLDPAMLEVDGVAGLAQALYRRIITPRGQLIDDPNYGFDVTQYVNDDVDQTAVSRCAAGVDAEFVKDERVVRSTTTAAFALGVLTVASVVTPSVGPSFRLTVAATAVTTTLLQTAV